jgi:hypothetical protein
MEGGGGENEGTIVGCMQKKEGRHGKMEGREDEGRMGRRKQGWSTMKEGFRSNRVRRRKKEDQHISRPWELQALVTFSFTRKTTAITTTTTTATNGAVQWCFVR